MEHIIALLNRVVTSAKINNQTDIELCATILIASIENDCVNELADTCENFTQQKVEEIIFVNEIERMSKLN